MRRALLIAGCLSCLIPMSLAPAVGQVKSKSCVDEAGNEVASKLPSGSINPICFGVRKAADDVFTGTGKNPGSANNEIAGAQSQPSILVPTNVPTTDETSLLPVFASCQDEAGNFVPWMLPSGFINSACVDADKTTTGSNGDTPTQTAQTTQLRTRVEIEAAQVALPGASKPLQEAVWQFYNDGQGLRFMVGLPRDDEFPLGVWCEAKSPNVKLISHLGISGKKTGNPSAIILMSGSASQTFKGRIVEKIRRQGQRLEATASFIDVKNILSAGRKLAITVNGKVATVSLSGFEDILKPFEEQCFRTSQSVPVTNSTRPDSATE